MTLLVEHQPDADGYCATVPAATVRQDQMTPVQVGTLVIILTRAGGDIHAVSAFCPHAAADLRQGSLYRGRLECPNHGYRFDVATGCAVWPEDEVCRLKRFPVRVEEGIVMVQLASGR
jgi:nitrite reductase/ring-hydroxylating ferredoxin subunit